jgi:hypothetical protein
VKTPFSFVVFDSVPMLSKEVIEFMSSLNYVTLKNRSSKTLTGRFDGKQHSFPPGYSGQWPENQALKFKEQNPVMGSEDYFSGYKEYLMAIVEHKDDDSPIEQTEAPERWSRAGTNDNTIIVKGRGYHPVQDRGRPAPSMEGVRTESIEAVPGDPGLEVVSIVDAIDKP